VLPKLMLAAMPRLEERISRREYFKPREDRVCPVAE